MVLWCLALVSGFGVWPQEDDFGDDEHTRDNTHLITTAVPANPLSASSSARSVCTSKSLVGSDDTHTYVHTGRSWRRLVVVGCGDRSALKRTRWWFVVLVVTQTHTRQV